MNQLNSKLKVLAAVAVVAALGFVMSGPVPASACGCGSWEGPVVASGKSPGGVDWEIQAVRHGYRNFSIEFRYSAKGEDMSDYGGGIGTFPSRYYLPVNATAGSGAGPENESDVSGIADWRTKELRITMVSGKTIRFKPALAPANLRKRWPWLNALRFFDQFFPGNQEPVRIAALNRQGKVIARQRL